MRRRSQSRLRPPPVEVLLALACLASALVLAASELMITFDIVDPGGEAIEELEAGDRHGYVMFVIAFFALFCLALAVLEGSKPAAVAVAVAGGLALLLFLIIDLPDAGQVGTVDEPVFFANAETEPRSGFWFELIGALSLAVSGAALATLTPEQLRLRWGGTEGRERTRSTRMEAEEGSGPKDPRRRELKASERSLARTQGDRRRERT
jgi:hypothetical protein